MLRNMGEGGALWNGCRNDTPGVLKISIFTHLFRTFDTTDEIANESWEGGRGRAKFQCGIS